MVDEYTITSARHPRIKYVTTSRLTELDLIKSMETFFQYSTLFVRGEGVEVNKLKNQKPISIKPLHVGEELSYVGPEEPNLIGLAGGSKDGLLIILENEENSSDPNIDRLIYYRIEFERTE